MAIDIGKAYVQIVPSAQGISGAISNVLNKESSDAGKKAGSGILSGIKTIISGAKGLAETGVSIAEGIAGAFGNTMIDLVDGTLIAAKFVAPFVKASMDLGAELEQNIGGAQAVFGEELFSSLENKAEEAYKNMGLSASDYMATANKMGSLFQGSGVTQEKSLELTTAAMQRAADVASIMGISTESAMESIAGAAKGNFTMMDNLGVAMNATTLQAYALEKKMYKFDWNKATNAEKAELAMKMFMEKTEQYAGNFRKESEESFSGALGAMQASAKDLMANLFMKDVDIGPYLANLLETVSTFVFGQLIPAIGRIAQKLPAVLSTAIQTAIPEFSGKVKDLINNMAISVQQNAPQLIADGAELLSNLAKGFADGFPELMRKIGEMIRDLLQAVWDNREQILEIGRNIIEGLIEGLWSMVKEVGEALLNIVKDAWKGVKDWLGIKSPSKRFMYIGEMTAEGLAKGLYGSTGLIQSAMESLLKPINDPIINPNLAYAGGPSMGSFAVTFNIDNSGKDITDKDIERWGSKITDVVNERMGRMYAL